ncbi:MAG TPA: hypothetical protein VHT53_12405 [Candidatus Elarobacter sp.]|nr:hypothetical protein [Candidatus Elarobacter sp.]
MSPTIRTALVAAVSLAVAAPAVAGKALADLPEGGFSPQPTAVVIRAAGGGPYQRANGWLWFAQDGTAENVGFAGPSAGRNFANVDFADVDRVVVDAGLCTKNIPAGRPFLLHASFTRLSIRCGQRWRYLTDYDASGTPSTPVRDAIRELQHIAVSAQWASTDDTSQLPDMRAEFHTAAVTR